MRRMSNTGRFLAISALLWLTTATAEAEFIGLNINASHWASTAPTSFDGTEFDSLILIDDLVLDTPALSLPHPHFSARRFVLEPLVEVAPDVVDPVTGLTARQLLDALTSVPRQ